MTMRSRFALTIASLLAGALAGTSGAQAQSNVEGRVGKLESEMRAVQRRVFPGGGGATLQPQIADPAVTRELPGAPATSAVAVHLASLLALFFSSVASTAPRWFSIFCRQSTPVSLHTQSPFSVLTSGNSKDLSCR